MEYVWIAVWPITHILFIDEAIQPEMSLIAEDDFSIKSFSSCCWWWSGFSSCVNLILKGCRPRSFCEMILVYILTKSNWRKNWSRFVRELGWATTWKWFGFLSKNYLQRWGSFLAEWSINKVCVFCQTAIHTYSMSHHCTPKKLRFVAVYGPAASLGRTSSVMIKTGTLLWMGISTLQWQPNIFGPNWMIWTWRTYSSNRTPFFRATFCKVFY